MIDNIKSIYFIKIIFSYVDEKRKLKIIKYNKNIKNKLDIHLVNYKFLSGKYVIFDPNGKGKEYDYRDNLVFEGEYLKGERNGKGKEYEYGKLLLEGEYIDGKRNGKGKEYYRNSCHNPPSRHKPPFKIHFKQFCFQVIIPPLKNFMKQ